MGKYRRRELAKSIALLALLACAVLQVGALWNEADSAFPFFSNINASNTGAPAGEAEEAPAEGVLALTPYRISVCDGEGSHYIISRRGEAFLPLAEISYAFFEEILGERALRNDLPLDAWGEISSRKGIMYEFAVPIRLDVLKWAVNFYNVAAGAPGEIRKLFVAPDEDASVAPQAGESGQIGAIYVLAADRVMLYSSKSKGYYSMQSLVADNLQSATPDYEGPGASVAAAAAAGAAGTAGAAAAARAAALEVAADGPAQSAVSALRYSSVYGEDGGRHWPVAPDVLGVMTEPGEGVFRKLRCDAPADIRDRYELENIILGNDIYSYTRSTDSSNAFVFRNITSVYRLHPGGFMDYRYTQATQPNEKGSMANSLHVAAAFVQNIETQLLGSASLYLSGIYENESDLTYKFTFDYILDDYPVFFKYLYRQGDEIVTLRNAVTVAANENRVLSCQWMLVDLFFGSDTKQMQVWFNSILLPEGAENGGAGGGSENEAGNEVGNEGENEGENEVDNEGENGGAVGEGENGGDNGVAVGEGDSERDNEGAVGEGDNEGEGAVGEDAVGEGVTGGAVGENDNDNEGEGAFVEGDGGGDGVDGAGTASVGVDGADVGSAGDASDGDGVGVDGVDGADIGNAGEAGGAGGAGEADQTIVDVSIAYFMDMDAYVAGESIWPSWALSTFGGDPLAGLSHFEAPMREGRN